MRPGQGETTQDGEGVVELKGGDGAGVRPCCHLDSLPEEVVWTLFDLLSLRNALALSSASHRYRRFLYGSRRLHKLNLKRFWPTVTAERLKLTATMIRRAGGVR